MQLSARRLSVLAAVLFLVLGSVGCSIDYGFYRVDYAYGYECSPHYHTQWTFIDGHPSRYHAPCDGVRTIVSDACMPRYRYRSGPCP